MITIDNYDHFYEREHGYVFNKKQFQQLILDIRNDTIAECSNICHDMADLTKPCPTGDEFKHAYIFAGNKIMELKYENLGNE